MASRLESRLENLPLERRRAGVEAPPERVSDIFRDRSAAPAVYLEAVPEGSETAVPVIIHNFRYYEAAMRQWDAGLVELLVLNELHELTHWAMDEEERAFFEERSQRNYRPDGYWLNPVLLGLIGWLPGDLPDVFEPKPGLRDRILGRLRKLLPAVA